jgi:hypothetical protein
VYVLIFILTLGGNVGVHVSPVVFDDYSSCEEVRMQHERNLNASKPEGGGYISRCVNMDFVEAAAPLEAALLIAENDSESSPQDDPHDTMWYEKKWD